MKLKRKTLPGLMVSFLAVFLLLFLRVVSAVGQTETGQVTVKASDSQGAVLPGATVTIKSVDKGTTLPSAKTNDEGVVTITNLQPGLYEITVTGGNFSPFTQQVRITVGAKLSVEATLSPTAQSATVTIVAGEGGVEINTQTQELSDVVSQKQITELPTLTRNPYDLVGLAGNVSDGDSANNAMRGTGFAINGQRSASTNILLDGGENVDLFTATVGQSVPLDAVQEFRVITSNFSAEYGRASGGIVNVATKAGSNNFHGSLYEFNRVSALASNSFDRNANGLDKSVFTRNQFGYSVGGRVIKDKLFFFSSTEWTRIRSAGEVISLVPTPELLARTNANTQNYFKAFSLVAPINGTIHTVAQTLANFNLPATGAFGSLPGNLPAFGEVRATRAADFGAGAPVNDYQTVGRLDYNWSEKTQIYIRGVYEQGANPDGTVSFSPYQGFNTGNSTSDQNYLVNVTHSFSPTLVGQTKVVFNRLRNGDNPLGQQPRLPTLYFTDQGVLSAFGKFFRFPGYLPTTPGSGIPFGGPQNFIQAYEDMNWTRGAHQLRFGGQYVHIRDNRTFGAYAYASAVLGLNAQSALNNFVNGQLRRFTVAAFPQGKFPCHNDVNTGATILTPACTLTTPLTSPNFSRSNRYHEWAAYFNDSWKVKPRLTLNLGVRYEYYGTQHNANQALDSNFYPGAGATRQEQIANGQIMLAKDSPIGKLWEVDPNNFAPRLGIAWDVFGDGKTSLRGGYGMAYERNFGNVTFNVIQNPPNNATIQFNAGTDVPSIPITLDNLGPLAGSGATKAFTRVSLRAVDPHIRNAYAHFWSAAFERQIWANSTVAVGYSGSAGRNLYSIANINRSGTENVYLGKGPKTDLFGDGRPLQGVGRLNNNGAAAINFRGSDGRSNYHAMIVSFDTSRLRNLGLRLGARYTYSMTKDNLSTTFSEDQNGNFNLGYLDPFNPDLDYGFSNNDVRHRFVTNFTWEVPSPKSAKGWVRQVVGGWEVNGIFLARTGAPFSVFDCTNQVGVCSRAILSGAVNLIGRVNHDAVGVKDIPNRYNYIDLSNLTPGEFIDRNGFGEFPPFPSNMSKRNAFRAPGVWNLDAALYKNLQITEQKRIQLRFETYNTLNHANLFVSGGEAEVGTGFVPAFFDGRRNVQIAAKFIF